MKFKYVDYIEKQYPTKKDLLHSYIQEELKCDGDKLIVELSNPKFIYFISNIRDGDKLFYYDADYIVSWHRGYIIKRKGRFINNFEFDYHIC